MIEENKTYVMKEEYRMQWKRKILVQCVGMYIVSLLVVCLPVQAQNNTLRWSSFNMGYATTASSRTMVRSVVGQSFVGYMEQGNNVIESGCLADSLFRSEVVGVKEEPPSLPMEFGLSQNYPNPFNPSTSIRYDIPKSSFVVLKIFNLLGQVVATPVEEAKQAGTYEVKYDASHLTSGVYFYQLKAGTFSETKKFMLIK